jgi:hypothetical protein
MFFGEGPEPDHQVAEKSDDARQPEPANRLVKIGRSKPAPRPLRDAAEPFRQLCRVWILPVAGAPQRRHDNRELGSARSQAGKAPLVSGLQLVHQ